MQLYIVRHGIAIDREDPKCPPDPERYLSEEGVEKTKAVAKGLASLRVAPGLFVTSPYTRAVQTAEIFADALDYSKQKIRRSELLLPGAEPTLLFRELARDKQASSIFLFGHAPHLDDVIATARSEEHTSELQSRLHLVCRLLLEKKKKRLTHRLLEHQAPEQVRQDEP